LLLLLLSLLLSLSLSPSLALSLSPSLALSLSLTLLLSLSLLLSVSSPRRCASSSSRPSLSEEDLPQGHSHHRGDDGAATAPLPPPLFARVPQRRKEGIFRSRDLFLGLNLPGSRPRTPFLITVTVT
jgi:predicted membrane metal-binding protein